MKEGRIESQGDVCSPATLCHATARLVTSRGGRFARHGKHCSVTGAPVARRPVSATKQPPDLFSAGGEDAGRTTTSEGGGRGARGRRSTHTLLWSPVTVVAWHAADGTTTTHGMDGWMDRPAEVTSLGKALIQPPPFTLFTSHLPGL
jgi:hypothetical protein